MVDNWKNIIQRMCYPALCLLCGARAGGDRCLCGGCAADLPLNTQPCRTCGLPLTGGQARCGTCLRRKPPFESCHSPYLYSHPLDRLILDMKFNQKLTAAELLGELLADHLAATVDTVPDMMIPVPLHPRRLRQRGYNQVQELARPVARRLQIPLGSGSCRRVRDTPSQSGLCARERKKNLRSAFEVVRPLEQAHVAIIDDVMTTGATVTELSKTLLRAGVRRVDVWCLARA